MAVLVLFRSRYSGLLSIFKGPVNSSAAGTGEGGIRRRLIRYPCHYGSTCQSLSSAAHLQLCVVQSCDSPTGDDNPSGTEDALTGNEGQGSEEPQQKLCSLASLCQGECKIWFRMWPCTKTHKGL
ncbi:hypothetical protein AALO_G00269410 [Alosa alosa]|uniref:Uncharacterized protein n=1 Tax=Alosa alosa TaxID=278164 RepID=A0AAV6FRY5_9TELE|nr:hypothetical protein AALO_G00269410 [Alosa alosa]